MRFASILTDFLWLQNGRGAFSESLAEYVMAAALHFNKQIPRCQANRKAQKWDKFVMEVSNPHPILTLPSPVRHPILSQTLDGKTIGFLGFGHIAQRTATVAKAAFNMKGKQSLT